MKKISNLIGLCFFATATSTSTTIFADNVSLGNGAKIEHPTGNAIAGAVAIGEKSTTESNAIAATNIVLKDGNSKEITIDANKFAGNKNIAAGDQISIGSQNNERQLKNLAAGAVNENSTDAVNGSQLYAIADSLAKGIKGNQTEVLEGKNVKVTEAQGSNGQTIYNVATNSEVDFDKVTVGKVTIDKNNGINAGNTKVTNIADGEISATSKDAINGSQLYTKVAEARTEVVEGKNVKVTEAQGSNGQTIYNVATNSEVDFDKVTVGKVTVDKNDGINAGNTKISNISAGTKTMDAVNLGQLKDTVNIFGGGSVINNDGSIKNPTYNINGNTYNNVGDALGALDHQVNNIQQNFDNRINKVENKLSAGIASALALESAPTVAGKYTYSASTGYYNGQAALGVSLRKTADNGRWSLSSGIAAATEGQPGFRIGIHGVID